MSRYLQTVMGHGHTPEGKTVASAEQMQTIWTPQIRVDGRLQYGLGWIVGDFKGEPILSHGGRTTGFSSDMAFLPRANLGIVVLSNQFISPLPEALRDRLFELAFDQPQSLDSPIAVESVELHDMFHAVLGQTKPVDPDVAKPYLGTYHNAKLGDVTFTLDDGKLIMDIGEYQAELRGAPQNDGTYIGASGQVMLGGIEFSRNDAGAITMRYGAWEFAKTQ
jgi:CubicO group peptidase (beta-lactamase class C family)